MGPWSTIAASAAASQVLTSGIRQFNAIGQTFQDVFVSESSSAQSANSKADLDSSLIDSIAERVTKLFKGAGLDFNRPIELELSPLGNVYVRGQSLETAEIERFLDQDPTLRGLLSQLSLVTGSSVVLIPPAQRT